MKTNIAQRKLKLSIKAAKDIGEVLGVKRKS
jgi:hypothetical protein